MPRIRTIKPEFWGDEKLAPCSPMTRLVFLGLISMADDTGRMLDNVKVIDAFIFPESSETCRGAVDELSAMGRIRRGKTASGQRVIEIAKWRDHQKIDKPNPKACLPEIVEVEEFTDFRRIVDDASSNDRRHIDDTSAPRPTTYDLRPATKDQGSKSKPARKRAVIPPWVGECQAQWAAKVGHVTEGRIHKALGRAVDTHGWDAVSKGMADYLVATPGGKTRVEWFAERATFWTELAKEPMTDPQTCQPTQRFRVVVEGKVA
mgnify:CR=1 FL=1